MIKAIRIRVYPNGIQQSAFDVQFGCARWIWNNSLGEIQKIYRETGKGLSYFGMTQRLPLLKKVNIWLCNADSQLLQASLRNLAMSFQGFFEKRSRYPKFKSKHSQQSAQYPQRVKIKNDQIYFPKVGWVKAIVHRKISGKIKTVTITKRSCGHYYASILIDDGTLPSISSSNGKIIGIDLGLIDFAVTSDGSKFSNPRHIKKAEKNLKRKQQKLSHKVKGSNNRKKARLKVARAYERVTNARNDYLHKLSRRIVNENQVIVVEDLHVKGMMKNHNLAKAISDVGWGKFTRFIQYKATQEGKIFIKTNRFFPSSKACNSCGVIQEKMPLNLRHWTCQHCEAHHDRDINAAMNIRDEGKRLLTAGIAVTASGGGISHKRGRKSSVCASANESGNLLMKI